MSQPALGDFPFLLLAYRSCLVNEKVIDSNQEIARHTRGVFFHLRAGDSIYQQTDSVLEALLLESALIKKHQPKYNAREKDDKSYWYVVITDEEFPRALMIRGK